MSISAQFSQVDTWVFDLDQTLYPASCGLFPQIEKRMTAFVMQALDLPYEEARAQQKAYFHQYGTTLKGMMLHHNTEAQAYLDFVHAVEYDLLPDGTALRVALEKLPGRRLIFTAASRNHSDTVLERLGIADLFEGCFDIVDADFTPKPQQTAYDRFFAKHGVDGPKSAFFEDSARNLVPAKAMGMATVHVVPTGTPGGAAGLAAYMPQDAGASIDHSTTDVVECLEEIVGLCGK